MSISLAVNNTLSSYYSVRIDKKSWTKEKIQVSDLESRNVIVQDSRLGGSDKDVFYKDRLVAKLFANRINALKFIES